MNKQYSVITVDGREWMFFSLERAESFATKHAGSIWSWR